MKKIMVVDDDCNIRELLKLYLEKDEFEVVECGDGRNAAKIFTENSPDLVLLDIMLPYKDGWKVCREIREKSSCPIIMITAKGEHVDRILGLELGADDYVTKPFNVKEVVARIKAVLRRTYKEKSEKNKLEYENFNLDLEKYELLINGKKVEMPPKEMELLYFLASNPNMVFTRDQLLDKVWGYEYYGDCRTVDVHIKRLREKLEGVSEKWKLKTVWGVGYKFEVIE